MDQYRQWHQIPPHLATKTQLDRAGLRLAPDQRPVAIKAGGRGPYALYDRREALPKRVATPAQAAALAKARLGQRTCRQCRQVQASVRLLDRRGWCQPCELAEAEALARSQSEEEYRRRVGERRAAIEWAREMLAGGAVVVDTETTGLQGEVIEVAVVCATSGTVLLDTLVRPTVAIEAGATRVHGLADADVAHAPPWSEVWPRFQRAVGEGMVLAYNARFDRARIRHTSERAGVVVQGVLAWSRWGCLMLARSDLLMTDRWFPLGGGHRALGDAQAAREVLLSLAGAAPDEPPTFEEWGTWEP